LGDDQWCGQLFDQAQEACDSAVGCASVALAQQNSLGDADRSKALFAKAETLCDSIDDYSSLLRTAAKCSGSAELLRSGIQTAEKNLSQAPDLIVLAEWVLTYLKDRQWARSIYQHALDAPGAARRRSDIILSIKNRLGDPAWASELSRRL
jgi:hypothetical protein